MSTVGSDSPMVVGVDELPRTCVEGQVRGNGNGATDELILAVRYQRLRRKNPTGRRIMRHQQRPGRGCERRQEQVRSPPPLSKANESRNDQFLVRLELSSISEGIHCVCMSGGKGSVSAT